MLIIGLVLTFLNFLSAIWLMVFGKHGQRLAGWALTVILAVNAIYWLFSGENYTASSGNRVVVQALTLTIFTWLALISRAIWPILAAGICLTRLTVLVLDYCGVKMPGFLSMWLWLAVWITIPTMIFGEEILASSKKAMRWIRR